jgi:4-hydroxy-L-threonine phosphate dehydrogenase PdxA
MHVAAPHGGDARAAGAEQEEERERHLDEERQQDGLNGHDVVGPLTA